MIRPSELEQRIALYLSRAGGAASSLQIARDLLGSRTGSEESVGAALERLAGGPLTLVARSPGGWELTEEGRRRCARSTAADRGRLPEREEAGLASFVLVEADVRRGALHPFRIGLLRVEHLERTGGAEWPPEPKETLRRLARGLPVLVSGGPAQRNAVALWLGSVAPGPLLALDALKRRAGLAVRRRPASGERSESSALERAAAQLDGVVDLTERLHDAGLERWDEAVGWLEHRPRFDFSGRAFDRETLDALPDGPGVYRFFDREGELVYVGQSRRLRSRVSSYFRPGVRPGGRTARIAARAHRIEVLPEGSDLAAQVREASEIRRRVPLENRQRTIRERAPLPWSGDRIIILPAGRGAARDVFFLRGGDVVDRRRMSPDPRLLRRAEGLIARYYFGAPVQPALPGMKAGGRSRRAAGGARAPVRPGISRKSAEEAGRLLSSRVRRKPDRLLSYDPREAAGARDAARLLVEYIMADPSEGAVFIR